MSFLIKIYGFFFVKITRMREKLSRHIYFNWKVSHLSLLLVTRVLNSKALFLHTQKVKKHFEGLTFISKRIFERVEKSPIQSTKIILTKIFGE